MTEIAVWAWLASVDKLAGLFMLLQHLLDEVHHGGHGLSGGVLREHHT